MNGRARLLCGRINAWIILARFNKNDLQGIIAFDPFIGTFAWQTQTVLCDIRTPTHNTIQSISIFIDRLKPLHRYQVHNAFLLPSFNDFMPLFVHMPIKSLDFIVHLSHRSISHYQRIWYARIQTPREILLQWTKSGCLPFAVKYAIDSAEKYCTTAEQCTREQVSRDWRLISRNFDLNYLDSWDSSAQVVRGVLILIRYYRVTSESYFNGCTNRKHL